jgi:hypothetical protein
MAVAKASPFASSLPEGQELPEFSEIVLCPIELEYIWIWFKRIGLGRQRGMSLCPLSYSEILAWSTLYRIRLKPFEVDAIKALDSAYIEFFKEE